ncbi:MAG TPA: imidazolonepropionase [Vicinamibacterales bacterium]|jgi:imidazolonepropionase
MVAIRHLRQLITCAGPAPRAGARQRDVEIILDGAIAWEGERIVYAGTDAGLPRGVADGDIIDGRDCSVVPGFVDGHTHALYAGDRRDELRRRLAGVTYAEIAAAGGGIVSTVAATRSATTEALAAATRPRLQEMLACGTTTVEIKSGYGLTLEDELKMLRTIERLRAEVALDIVATFMGAHEIPVDYRSRRDDYLRLIIDEMIPAVARAGLADWCDVFCETGVFTPAESIAILEAGKRHGLRPRIHADELAASGGSQVAAKVGARSADHLIFADAASIEALRSAGTVATLLPTAAFYLKLGRFAPARAMIDAGVPVALATDVNPGGGFSPSMPFAITLACFGMGLTFEEALVAATINGAFSLDRHVSLGSLEPGKQMDAVLVRGDAIDLIRVGAASIARVVKRGRLL